MVYDPGEKAEEMLSPVEMDILVDLLTRGDNTPKNIAEYTGRERKNVHSRLQSLIDRGLVEKKPGGSVYSLTPGGVLAAQSIYRERHEGGE